MQPSLFFDMTTARLCLLLLSARSAVAQRPGQTPCVHGKPGRPWTEDAELREETLARLDHNRSTPSRWQVNLDLPPEERWRHVAEHYAPQAHLIHDYLASNLPPWAYPIVDAIAGSLDSYKGFGEYGAEMRGLAKGLNLSLGDVVAANLVYQLEGLGVNCSK